MIRIKSTDLLISLTSCLLCVIFGSIGHLVNMDLYIMMIYIALIVWIGVKRRTVFLKYFFLIFGSSWQIISVFAVENTNMYMPNLKQISYRTGSFFPLVLVNIIAFSFLLCIEARKKTNIKSATQFVKFLPFKKYKAGDYKRRTRYRLYAVAIGLLALVFVLDISRQNYYTSGASDRFYYSLALKAITYSFYGYLLFLYPILTINAYKNGKAKPLWIFTFLYGLYILLIGQKFGPFVQIFYFLLLTYYLPFKEELVKKYYKKILMGIFVILALGLIFSLWQMSLEKGSIGAGLEQLRNRIFNGQGDIWWGIYSKYSSEGLHIGEISDEFAAFGNSNILQYDRNYGIYKMMKLVAPNSVVLYYSQRGARFTASTDASIYYYFGLFGLILFRMVLMIVAKFLVDHIVKACKKSHGLEAVLYVWLMTHYLNLYSMSSFDLPFSKSAILCYLLLLCLHFYYRKVPNKHLAINKQIGCN